MSKYIYAYDKFGHKDNKLSPLQISTNSKYQRYYFFDGKLNAQIGDKLAFSANDINGSVDGGTQTDWFTQLENGEGEGAFAIDRTNNILGQMRDLGNIMFFNVIILKTNFYQPQLITMSYPLLTDKDRGQEIQIPTEEILKFTKKENLIPNNTIAIYVNQTINYLSGVIEKVNLTTNTTIILF